jgi:CSLREA domain-containing protein
MSMSNKQMIRSLRYLSIFACLLLPSIAVAATFSVNTALDAVDANPGDGVCETSASNNICTLRAAIEEANALEGDEQIILPPNTYLLTVANYLPITSSMTITGAGASTTIIDGNKDGHTNVPHSRVVFIPAGKGGHVPSVTLSGLTIRNGAGRGIESGGTVALINIVVSGNSDGGIWNGANMTIINSTVSGNSALVEGGGILSHGIISRLTLINSTVSGNSAVLDGGGISNYLWLRLTNSTVSGNSAGRNGGGISNTSNGSMTITNSTVSGNSAVLDGGGIWNSVIAILFNATITNNVSAGNGGGVFNEPGAIVYFQNTILAGNFEGSAFGECAGTIYSTGNNLMQNAPGDCTVSGQPVTLVDSPGIGPLQNNGGLTQTHAPLADSPAIEAGNPGGCRDQFGSLLTTDQRGFRRTVGSKCDIGAHEYGSGPLVPVRADADFDGDGRADMAVYRDGFWFIKRSSDGAETTVEWGGLPQDIPVPADYDGDAKADLAVYRDGTWIILRSSNGSVTALGFGGLAQDIPVPGDYDGDGKTDLAVYRNGIWFILRSFDGGVTTFGWGGELQDIPVAADYDGDNRPDMAIYRDGIWFVALSSGGVLVTAWGGLPQDLAVPADYDGDGRADLAVYRNGVWFIVQSLDGSIRTVGWGGETQDITIPADYDGDVKTDAAVYRDGAWFILQSSNGATTVTSWGGLPQDVPLN